jgi:hypothetical protein
MKRLMTEEWRLSPEQTARLALDGPFGDGVWGDFAPEEIPYGTPLDDLYEAFPDPGQFLQVAALAGYVDFIALEAALVALRAHYMFFRDGIADCEALGFLGDSIGQAEVWASGYRGVIVLLEGYVEELERWSALMHRRASIDASDEEIAAEYARSRMAERRAKRARVRARMAEADENSPLIDQPSPE